MVLFTPHSTIASVPKTGSKSNNINEIIHDETENAK